MKQKELVIKIINYIDVNIYTKISINNIANNMFFNKDYIMRVFKKELGITINQYINYKRIYLSLNYYMSSDSILSIALNNGFYSLEYYSEIFKKIIGISPSLYRNNYLKRNNIDIRLFNKVNDNIINLDKKLKYISNYKTTIKRKDVLVLSIFK